VDKMSTNPKPHVDEYASESMNAAHASPRLILDLPILPTWTLTLAKDGADIRLKRWYDVSLETLEGVDVRSRDFWPDGILRLVDKDGQEIRRATVKIVDEWDGLPVLLARVEKSWEVSTSFDEFWSKARDIMVRTPVPTFTEVVPGAVLVKRTVWMEFACFWIAYLAAARREQSGGREWQDSFSGDQLIFKYVEFYNDSPCRGPRINDPAFEIDRVKLSAHLEEVRRATTNQQKKMSLEALAGMILGGIEGFDVKPPVRAATGELDRIVRNNCTNPQFAHLGPILLVECKHWNKAAGTDQVGAFIADLQDARAQSGVLLSRNGVSPDGEIRLFNYHQRTGGFIIVLSEEDIREVCAGSNLARMIIEKMEAITFQRRTKRKQGGQRSPTRGAGAHVPST
jgi:hypothetical protein